MLECGTDRIKPLRLSRQPHNLPKYKVRWVLERGSDPVLLFTTQKLLLLSKLWIKITGKKTVLTLFYENCVAPETLSPVWAIGLLVHDLSKM